MHTMLLSVQHYMEGSTAIFKWEIIAELKGRRLFSFCIMICFELLWRVQTIISLHAKNICEDRIKLRHIRWR